MGLNNEQYKAARDGAAELAGIAEKAIAKVVMVSLGGKGFRYEAVYRDGIREVIRAQATRAYAYANLYPVQICSGKQGLGAVFKFSGKPGGAEHMFVDGAWQKRGPLKIYPIS